MQATLVLILVFVYGAGSIIYPYTGPCGICGDEIDLTIIAQNFLKSPFFNFSVDVHGEPQREFIYFLQKAADIDERFRFKLTYFGPVLGYFVNSINKLEGNYAENTSWVFTDVDFNTHKLGISHHIPNHHDTIIFSFTNKTYS
ncbi:uncharacterized protein [Haliotis cracherodii]|uniref:uncharacterized protein n=1 Tax=Haliotis cracherodii TaxID=6455 RepID=UPI0039ECDB8A